MELTEITTEVMPDEQVEMLAEHVVDARPRLFALYGLTRSGRDVLGWGMDFGDGFGAICYQPYERITHYSESAEQALAGCARLGDVTLHWLDEAYEVDPYGPWGTEAEV